MRLLLKFPTRARPDKFRETLAMYLNNLSGKHEIDMIISCDEDDHTMNNQKMRSFLGSVPNLKLVFGQSRTKVQAINANMEVAEDWQICLLVSDDMLPQKPGYDDIICSNMKKYFPDLDGALHFNDGRTFEKLNTLSIIGKKFYDRFGYIYHPDYSSLWCDNEFHEVSKSLGKTVYIDNMIIRHAWSDYTGKDPLHKRNESFFHKDKETFLKRQAAGFPKESIFSK
ncbi:MAG: hypothetical protein HC888_03000 [Candidatus Competibacteraceae bacterium]|nr:hypothetical protein [Candidatus Competibacteraceae bacterium]